MRKLTWFGRVVMAWFTEAVAGLGVWLVAKAGDIPIDFWDAMVLAWPAIFVTALFIWVLAVLARR